MSRWFRFYAEALRNPKVMRLSDKDFRLWVRLMAVASENDGIIPPLDDLRLILNMRLDHLSSGLDRLISGGLIDVLAVGYEPHNWSKFQYKSDTSTERVHKHRAKRNVSETAPDTETEEDTVADATGADAPQPTAIDLKAAVFATGVPLLTSTGSTDRNARSMIGRWRQSFGDGAVLDALSAATAESPSEPIPWITRTLETRNGNRPGRQSGWLDA